MYRKIFCLISVIVFILILFPTFTFGETTYKGIDVSHYQSTINWSEVANDGVEFAIIKATEGNHFLDSYFKENAQNAYNNNIAVGAYHVARFTSVNDAINEAEFFLQTIKNVNITYAVALDLEFTEGLDSSTLTSAASAFLEKVKDAGYTPLLYSYQYFFLTNINYTSLQNFDFWVARYSSNPPVVPFVIWQYTSSGSVSGISGNVDMNIAYLDLRQNNNSNSGGNSQNNNTSNETNTTINNTTNTTNSTNTIDNNENSTNNTNIDSNINNTSNGNLEDSNYIGFIAFFLILLIVCTILCVILIIVEPYIMYD